MNNYRDAKTGRYVKSPANRSQELLAELYRAFNFFNKKFVKGELPNVVITVQNQGRRNALGWFGKGFWADKVTDNGVSEINLSAEYVARGPNSLLETLLHEMAHLYNASKGIRDCTGGQYHNKHFKVAAERFGLKVGRYPNRGYAATSLDKAARKAIKELQPNKEVYGGLRRRPEGKSQKRYASLIVGHDVYDLLQTVITKSSMSQKEAVEQAIINLHKEY